MHCNPTFLQGAFFEGASSGSACGMSLQLIAFGDICIERMVDVGIGPRAIA